ELHGRGRSDDPGLSHPAPRQGAQEPPAHRAAARRSRGAGQRRLRLVVAGARRSGLRGAAAQLSRLDPRQEVPRGRLRAGGPQDSAVEAISPISHVGSITMPVLLIHGKDDTVVPFEQSQLMYDALKRARKDVQLVTLKHEDHWLSRGETRLQMLQASVAFLRAHNPPD